jgi:hypothetical protein
MEKLPPTRYVPAGRVVEVTTFVVPLFVAALVVVFTIVGGTRAFTADGATMYAGAVELIC